VADGITLVSSSDNGNQWYFSPTKDGAGTEVTGATGRTITPTQTGWYWSQVTILGCKSDFSSRVYRLKPGEENRYNIFPVPNNGEFTITIVTASQEVMNISIYDQMGNKFYEQTQIEINGEYSLPVNLRNASTGVYSVKIMNKARMAVIKKFNIFR
jgi:hypothetical protein